MLPAVILTVLLAGQPEKPRLLLDELVESGLNIPGGPRVKLPAPTMPDGLTPEKQQAILDTFAEDFPPGLFVSRTSTAPYKLKIRSLGEGKKNRRGHVMDLHFVAYGTIEQMEKDNVLDHLLGLRDRAKKAVLLDDEELKTRKIVRTGIKDVEERFSALNANLVDKVQLTGVLRTQRQDTKKSVVAAAVLDERFENDPKHPNRWHPLELKPGGTLVMGKPSPYRGFGGYVKVTELAKPAGALFIELHFIFHEPYDWFEGHNVLASKLPIAVRDNVQTLRRKLDVKKR